MAYLELTEKDSEQLLIEKEAKKLRDDLNHDPQLKREIFLFLRGEKKLDDASPVAQEYLRDLGRIARDEKKRMNEGALRVALKNILNQEIDQEAREVVDDLNASSHSRKEVFEGLRHEIIGPKKKPSEAYDVYMLGVRKTCEERSLDFRAVKQKIYALLKKEVPEKEVPETRISAGQEEVRKKLRRLSVGA